MSNKVSVLVYSRKIGSPVRKAVLVYFAERASDNGEGIWASKSTIADAIECGRSTVIRTINDFVSEGILRQVGTRKCRTGETVEYAMMLPVIASLPKVKSEGEKPSSSPAAGPVPKRDQSQSGTPPVPQRDPHPSQSGTQTTIGTIIEPSTTAREAQPAVVDASGDSRREQVLILMGCTAAGITPQGRFTGTTNDKAEIAKWDDLGLSRSEQDGVIRDMLAKQRRKDPNFMPNRWSWFTAGMDELSRSKSARPSAGSGTPTETPEQRRARRRKMIGG